MQSWGDFMATVWILRWSAIPMATRPRRCERVTAARTCSRDVIGGSSGSNPAIKPPIPPVHQPKAVDLAVVTGCLDQTLSSSSFSPPDTCECWMESELHLLLQIEVCTREASEQFGQIGGKLIPQISLDQVLSGWRSGCCGTS